MEIVSATQQTGNTGKLKRTTMHDGTAPCRRYVSNVVRISPVQAFRQIEFKIRFHII